MKKLFESMGTILAVLIFAAGYINNIIWLFDHWGSLAWIGKALNIGGVFVPPLGALLGIIHFF